jgi:spermidine/putrescine transport system permease protein
VSIVATRDASLVEGWGGPKQTRKQRRLRRFVLPIYSALVILYLLTPIFIIVLYGFNQTSPKKVAFRWGGFTLRWYRKAFVLSGLTAAFKNSLMIAAISTIIATILGTLVALALFRYRYRGKGATEGILFANIAAPEIVLGASLLSLFVLFGVPRGIRTIIIAHVMFNIAYVAVTVRARMAGFDRAIEEAAQDLGANPLQTFIRVTLPLIFPGILAGALLAFALSIDDFIITNFVSGAVETFPIWVYGAVKVGIPPQVFVMGTLIFLTGVTLAAANLVLQRRKA